MMPIKNELGQALTKIPDEVISLLWFYDGPLKNIHEIKKEGAFIKYLNVSDNEPSAISINMEVSKYIDDGSLFYWPSYEGLTPGQRLYYLKWLCDITKPVDFGYVFIYYYGLERHLVYGKFDEAFKMINKLRNWHKCNSFQEYSANAMVLACLINKRAEMIDKIVQLPNTSFLDLMYCYQNKELSPNSILKNINCTGWKNKRYLKKDYDKFINTLGEVLTKQFGQATFPITQDDLNKSPKTSMLGFANYSFNPQYYVKENIFYNQDIQKKLYKILEETHNVIKRKGRFKT